GDAAEGGVKVHGGRGANVRELRLVAAQARVQLRVAVAARRQLGQIQQLHDLVGDQFRGPDEPCADVHMSTDGRKVMVAVDDPFALDEGSATGREVVERGAEDQQAIGGDDLIHGDRRAERAEYAEVEILALEQLPSLKRGAEERASTLSQSDKGGAGLRARR